MRGYKLTLLGKFIVLIFVIIMVMFVVMLSNFLSGGNPPDEIKSPPDTHLSNNTDTVPPPAATPTVIPEIPPSFIPSPPPVSAAPSEPPENPEQPDAADTIDPLRITTILYFQKDSATLSPDAAEEAERFAALPDDISDFVLVISGNASSDEGVLSSDVQTLSRDRALAVMRHLKDTGVSEKYMTLVANGSNNEIKSKDEDAAALSRNVELSYILNMK